MKRKFILCGLLVLLVLEAGAQTGIEDLGKLRGSSNEAIKAAKIDIPNKTGFVMLNPDYPVTPGDTYTISYLYNLKVTSLPFFVESDYTANLSFFGKINVRGKSFGQLRTTVEAIVTRAYPDSLPRLVIESVGAFPVLVKGEVRIPAYFQGWGFSRLSDAVADRLSPYSSLRDIEVVSADGRAASYDLYQAVLTSDLARNPIIRPGDVVIVHRLRREVFVKGEVHREGAFQLLPGEELGTVLDQFAGDLTSLADAPKAFIIRFLGEGNRTDTLYIDLSSPQARDTQLQDLDILVVPGLMERLPMVFFEGALFFKPGTKSPIAAVIPFPITGDQRISTALANLPDGAITPVSDLERATIVRASTSEVIPVDLHRIYYLHDLSADPALEEGDRIIIPTKFFSVFVGGAVEDAGAQPYVAGKTYMEYIQLAGGFNPELTTGKGVRIYDREGERQPITRIIQPEDKIYVPRNNPLYVFTRQIGPIITTLAAALSLVLNLDDIIGVLTP